MVRAAVGAMARSAAAARLLDRLAVEIEEGVGARQGGTGAAHRVTYQMRRAAPPSPGGSGGVDGVVIDDLRPGVDDAAVVGLMQEVFAWHRYEEWHSARLADERAVAGTRVRVATRAGDVVGVAVGRVHEVGGRRRGELVIIGVAASARGTGTAAALVDDTVTWLVGRGVDHVYLYVDADNLRAVRCYLRAGFFVQRVEHRYDEAPLSPP